MNIKNYKQFNFSSQSLRFVFQNQGPEPFIPTESENLDKISDAVKNSVENRNELATQIESRIADIHPEQQQHKQVINQLKLIVQTNHPTTPVTQNFNCLGENITVIMYPDFSYEEKINNHPINFLSWAIQKKKTSGINQQG